MESALPAAQSFQPRMPMAPQLIKPGVTSGDPRLRKRVRRVAPARAVIPGTAAIPATAAPGPAAPAPRPAAAMAGLLGRSHGPVTPFTHVGPYSTIRTSSIMPFRSFAWGGRIQDQRSGPVMAPRFIRRVHSANYPYASVPAGYYRSGAL
jgi:hypothetical protein